MIDGVGVRLGPLCDRLLKPHAGSLIEGRELSGPELFLEPVPSTTRIRSGRRPWMRASSCE